jgi:hypothetical protein
MPTSIRFFVLLTISLLAGPSGPALNPRPQSYIKHGGLFPTVTFTFSLWNGSPPFYSVSLDSTGNAAYHSTPSSDEQTGDPYMVEFVASNATRQRVFRITQDLHFFNRIMDDNVRSGDAGTRTLTFSDGKLHNQISYHSSANILVQQLTDIFENIAITLEFGHRLSYMRQHGDAGIDNELKRMEEMAQDPGLIELRVVCPVLQAIASDPSAGALARQLAQEIAKRATSESGSDASSHQ